jgi:O-antigen ligase/tetratricopeptide (TPR) repeat protein
VLILAVAIFLSATNLFAADKNPVLLLTIAAAVGVVAGLSATWHSLSAAHDTGAAWSVDRSTVGCFLNACLAAALGLVAWAYSRRSKTQGSDVTANIISSSAVRSSPRLEWFVQQVTPIIGFLVDIQAVRRLGQLAIVVIPLGIIFSYSRDAWLALTGGLVALTLPATLRFRAHAWARLLLPAAVILMVLVAWLGRAELIGGDYPQTAENPAGDSRLDHWRDGLRAAAGSPFLGNGFGTYGYVYPVYEQDTDERRRVHADNQYVEALAEGGLVGLGLLVTAIALLGLAASRLLREPPESTGYVCGLAGLFLVTTQAIHGFLDSGPAFPATLFLAAGIAGVVAGRAARVALRQDASRSHWFQRFRSLVLSLPQTHVLGGVLGAFLIAGMIWAIAVVQGNAAVQTALRAVPVPTRDKPLSADLLDARLADFAQRTRPAPGNIEVQRRLADLWIQRYRLRTLSANASADQPADEIWESTSLQHLHRQAAQPTTTDNHDELSQPNPADVPVDLANAARHLLLAQAACPLAAEVSLRLAELEPVVAPRTVAGAAAGADQSLPGVWRAGTARQLAGADARLLAECGTVELQAGQFDPALVCWQRSIALDPRQFPDVLRQAVAVPEMAEKLESLLPDSPEMLVEAARNLAAKGMSPAICTRLLNQAETLLPTANLAKQDQYHLLGRILALQGKPTEAIENYSLAVELQPDDTQCRFELAMLLQAAGNVDKAREHVAACLRLDPDNKEFETALTNLIRQQGTNR